MRTGNRDGDGLDLRQNDAVGPLISVLLPVRNGIKHIAEAIDSISDQTLIDWELVITDDASTDGTDAYVRRRAAQDPRIVFHRNESELGVAGNLNAGLALCRGAWIARMEPEDRAMPKWLERQLAYMLQNRDAAVVSCLAYYIDDNGERTSRAAHDVTAHGDESVLHSGSLIRRETLERVGYGGLAEAGPSLVQPECLIEYRIDANSQAARFIDTADLEALWAEECSLARREGNPEPTWEQFLWRQRSRLLQERLMSEPALSLAGEA